MNNKDKLECWFNGFSMNISLEGVRNPTQKDFEEISLKIHNSNKSKNHFENIDFHLNDYLLNNKTN